MFAQLTGRVVALHDGFLYSDEMPRVTLRVNCADSISNELRFPVPFGETLPELGDEYHLTITKRQPRADLAGADVE